MKQFVTLTRREVSGAKGKASGAMGKAFPLRWEGVPVEVGSILLEGESGRSDLGDERNEEYYPPRDMYLMLDVRIAQ